MEPADDKNRENNADSDQGNKLDTTNKTQDENILDDVNNDNNQDSQTPKNKFNKNAEETSYSVKASAYGDENQNEDYTSFYGINKRIYRKSDKFEPPKTGLDFNLLPQNPQFIKTVDHLEPVYIPKQNILEESLKREAEKICFRETQINRVVYDCADPSIYTKNLNSKDYGMDVLPYYIPTSKEDTTLVFESRFESGNLRRAIQIYDYEYDLILKPDYYTRGHTQWYYFSVANIRKDKEYRFNIINMMKPDSLYNCGMKPLVYSEGIAKNKKIGWHRDGYDICYYQNNMKRRNAGYYYTLTFSIKFKYDFDTAYFAHCYPYTYSDLCAYVKCLEDDPVKKTRVRRKLLCQTIAGNNCDLFTITNFEDDFEANRDKRCVIVTARVHPGETQASFVMENIMDFLVGNSSEAKILRDTFVFKIVPMLNPDGVLVGNYRCNLAGVDLNRQWIDPAKKLHPSIFHTKLMLKKMKDEREIVLYCDIHGHSRKKNIFIYGCSGKDNKRRELIYPMLFRNNCDFFSFKDSSFVIQKDRESTARINLWRELSIINCYTLELSFCGPDVGEYEYYHFNYEMFKKAAVSFCVSLVDLCDPEQTKVKQIMEEIEQNILKPSGDKKDDSNKPSNKEDIDSDYSGDDTEPPAKENPPPQSLGTLDNNSLSSVSSQNIFLQGSNQSGLQATQAAAQKRQLAVINEIDDRKDGKKKTANAPATKKKSK